MTRNFFATWIYHWIYHRWSQAPEVVADTERRAQVAYQRLFGDGRGLDGGAPMAWQHFHERFLAHDLHDLHDADSNIFKPRLTVFSRFCWTNSGILAKVCWFFDQKKRSAHCCFDGDGARDCCFDVFWVWNWGTGVGYGRIPTASWLCGSQVIWRLHFKSKSPIPWKGNTIFLQCFLALEGSGKSCLMNVDECWRLWGHWWPRVCSEDGEVCLF